MTSRSKTVRILRPSNIASKVLFKCVTFEASFLGSLKSPMFDIFHYNYFKNHLMWSLLGPTKSNNINRKITVTNEIYLLILSKCDIKIWSSKAIHTKQVFKDCALIFFYSWRIKPTNKIITLIFWLWGPQSLTHTAEAKLLF